MALAVGDVGPGWAVNRGEIRRWKEALRTRIYGPGERELRDSVLARMVALLDDARQGKIRFE